MKPAELAPGMVFSCWTVIGPACPEFRRSGRYVECECWCMARHEVSAVALINGTSRRCKSCGLGRKRAVLWGRSLEATELKAHRTKRAQRLALIRQVAEARA